MRGGRSRLGRGGGSGSSEPRARRSRGGPLGGAGVGGGRVGGGGVGGQGGPADREGAGWAADVARAAVDRWRGPGARGALTGIRPGVRGRGGAATADRRRAVDRRREPR